MSHKKAKRIRKELNKVIGNKPFAIHEFVPSNPDIAQAIKSRGLENVVKALGHAPLTCVLTPECRKYHYQKAKKS